MPNINSIITDFAGQAIKDKLSGGKHKDQKPDKDSKGGLIGGINLGSALNQISSAFSGTSSSKAKDSYHQATPSDPHTTMSGYPPHNPYPPTQNPPSQGYPGYPSNQPPTSGYPGYGAAPYPGGGGGGSGSIGFNLESGPGYPPQSQPYPGAGYPSSGPGYPTSGSGQPPYPQSGTGSAYQPNVGYGQPGGGYGAPPTSGYPQQGYGAPPTSGYPQQPPQSQPYSTGSVYPTHASDSVQQIYGGPPQSQHQQPGGGYPGQRPTNVNMYQSAGTPTIKPNSNFNANHSAEMLRKAMKGLGCDKNKVIQALCTCSNWQRQEVIKQFKVMYGKDLISELKSELSGDFEDLIMALMETPARYDAQQLRKAMAGLGTKESVLIEIMTTRSNAQIQELKFTYKQLFGKDLEHDLVGETSGHFKRLLVSLCAGGRDESWNVDPLRANQDARALYRAGEQRLGTDESTFNAILASQNFPQLRMVFDEYQKVSNHTIEHAIQAEFSGDIRDGLLAIVKSIRNRAAYFAELIYNSMKGLGTRDTDLIRLIVTRSEIDLGDIRNQYHAQYRTSLEKAIAGDCSGAYKEGLIALVKGN